MGDSLESLSPLKGATSGGLDNHALSLAAFLLLGAPGLVWAQQPPPQSGQAEQPLEKKKNPSEEIPKPLPKIEMERRPEMTFPDDGKARIKVSRIQIIGATSSPESTLPEIAQILERSGPDSVFQA